MMDDVGMLRGIRHVALDLDGTLYKGGKVFAFTAGFLRTLRELGVGYSFLTNNSSKSVADYVGHLRGMGIDAEAGEIRTSTQATVEWLGEELPGVRRVFVLGTASMKRELEAAGFVVATGRGEDAPEAVVVGFDTNLPYADLCLAGYWIQRGLPFVATHPDRVCPTDEPTMLVDCGAVCAALESATGRKPDKVLGKPDARMVGGLLRRFDLRGRELAVVGDRLYTDMALARNAGAVGVLVLTGETTKADAAGEPQAADLIVADVGEFGEKLRDARGRSLGVP